jgi:primosomal protein N' (replication factor Y) (superfamily II helicase)
MTTRPSTILRDSLQGETQNELFECPTPPAPAASGLFAEVVFDRPLDHPFTYSVPEELRTAVAVGKRVQAPFGKGDRATTGYCVHLGTTVPERTVKPLLRVLDAEPLLDENLLRLTRWMADYYLCSWGQVLSIVVPYGARAQAGTRATTFLQALPENQWPTPPPRLTPKQTAVFAELRDNGKPVEQQRLARQVKCGPGPIEQLVQKGLIKRVVRRVDSFARLLEPGPDAPESAVPVLTADQQAAWQQLEPVLQQGGFHPVLLYGVTGSGKTELYLRAIEEVIKRGQQAIVLVPEISLTPQTIQCFRGRCGQVAVLHSHLGNAERGAQWRRIAAGEVQVVVGARSAVFAPTKKLGLIVIDEEHESSFKQDATPRYHGRDVAVMRARLQGIPIVLGSATPSLESWHNAQRGQYQLLRLPQRVQNLPMPEVSLIDMRHEIPHGGRFHALSPTLESAVRHALGGGGQVILFLNRRGFSTHLHCPACGYVEQCKFCDLALTFHRWREVAMCHHCGFETPPPDKCPKCGQAQVRFQGTGTEKLQLEVEEKFAGYIVRRMDSDSMKRPGSHGKLLGEFRRGEVHILLGTQMIAKGLDFPNVTLVGVINADIGLHLPDFRAAERTFQLLSQVAGRTGRGPRGGRVLVQTYSMDHPGITLAATHNYEQFASIELGHRKLHNYPPYHRLARLIVRSRNREEAEQFAERLAGGFRVLLEKMRGPKGVAAPLRLLGPAEAPVFRLKGYYRYHFQLQSPSPGALHQLLRQVLGTVKPQSGVDCTVDIDPYDML